jgi:hypothetical protein
VHVESESKSGIGNNRGEWNCFEVTQTLPEQCSDIARNQRTTESSHIGHCTHTVESANVKVHNILQGRNNITHSTNCKYRTAATLYTLETWFVSGI